VGEPPRLPGPCGRPVGDGVRPACVEAPGWPGPAEPDLVGAGGGLSLPPREQYDARSRSRTMSTITPTTTDTTATGPSGEKRLACAGLGIGFALPSWLIVTDPFLAVV